MLAKQNGWLECAQVLREWILNKDRDLRERETVNVGDVPTGLRSSRSRDGSLNGADTELSTSLPRRRLQVKHSIDTALNMFKSSPAIDSHAKSSSKSAFFTNTPPASPTRHLELATSPESSIGSERISPVEHRSRRPSLPHLFPTPLRTREVSNPTPDAPLSGSRRPRSAGTDAEREEEEVQSTLSKNAPGKRLCGKYSLMNMFRKAHNDTFNGSITPDFQPGSSPKQTPTVHGSQITPSHLSVPSQAMKPAHDIKKDKDSISIISHRLHRGSDASTQSQPRSASPRSIDRHNLSSLDDIIPSSDTGASTHKRVTSDVPRDPAKSTSPVSMLSILRGKGHNRERSCSNSSSYSFQSRYISCSGDGIPTMAGSAGEGESGKGISRSGILLGHNRSSSSGQSTPLSSSYKALRFEYSLNDPEDSRDTGQSRGLRSVNSAGSIARAKAGQGDATHINNGRTDLPPVSAPVVVPHLDDRADGASSGVRVSLRHKSNGRPPSANTLSTRRRGGRISSLSSSSDSAASLLPMNDGLINETYGKLPINIGTPSRSLPGQTGMAVVPPVSPPGIHSPANNSGTQMSKSDGGPNGRSVFEIDIRSISSHAQAEALVQQTQKEILEMGEQEILADGSAGNTPLSARLAAYGESLALERKLREEMGGQQKIDHFETTSWSSPSGNGFPTIGPTRNHLKIIRQHSLDDKLGGRKDLYRQMQFQKSLKVQGDTLSYNIYPILNDLTALLSAG
ncbi:hypothetical protein AX15_004250 [Amanita polypyramis BW_CC]|nr:hypothetical protein AX15_004250 [Amanita polypyramis BW_CC]